MGKNNERHWRRYEKKVAAKLGMTAQPASGALRRKSMKTDMRRRGEARGENKYTSKGYFQLTAKALDKLWAQTQWDEDPVFTVVFHPGMVAKMVMLVPADDGEEPTKVVNKTYRLRADDVGEVIKFDAAEHHQVWRVEVLE